MPFSTSTTRFWPIEVNPRYTASVEILERGLGVAALGWHVAACRDRRIPAEVPKAQGWHGKAIVYAPCDLQVGEEFIASLEHSNANLKWPEVADLPAPGTVIRWGQPVVTVFAEALDRLGVEQHLNDRTHAVAEMARAAELDRIPGS